MSGAAPAVFSMIGRCRACKGTKRRDYPETRTITLGTGMYERTSIVAGRTTPQGNWIRATADYFCPDCGKAAWDSKPMKKRLGVQKCGARCYGATGHDCECQCGGENHGRAHLVCE